MSQFVLLPSRVQIQIQNAQTQVQRTVTVPAVVRLTVMLSGLRRLMPLCPFYKVIEANQQASSLFGLFLLNLQRLSLNVTLAS